jgi:hypothetical protein
LGLIVQGLALAIVNKELKTIWKYSTEQTLEDVRSDQTSIETRRHSRAKRGEATTVRLV